MALDFGKFFDLVRALFFRGGVVPVGIKFTGLYVLLLTVLSCSNNKSGNVIGVTSIDSVEVYSLLNYVLTDTVDINFVSDGYKIVSDIERLPPPTFPGTLSDHICEILSEKDTVHIIRQLKTRKDFKVGGLKKYGFTVVKVSEMDEADLSGEKFWEIIHNNYGPGLLTVSLPIFNVDFTKAYVRVGYSCGELCGGGEDFLIKKINGKWILVDRLGRWVS
jgi:hypothetical protein